MAVSDRSLVCTEQPSLQQRDYKMNARKHMLILLLVALYLAVMRVSDQAQIGGQAIRSHRASRFNGLGYESL